MNMDFNAYVPQSTLQATLESLTQDYNRSRAVNKRLVRLPSFSSLSDSGRSEDSREEKPSGKSKFERKSKQAKDKKCSSYQIKKKTELCKTYELGFECMYGNKCSFAHGREELCAKVLVPANYKTVKCKQFFETGYCRFGARCQFLHEASLSKALILPTLSYGQLFDGIMNSVERGTESNLTHQTFGGKPSFRRLQAFQRHSTGY